LWAAWALIRLFGLERGYPLVPLIAYTPYVAAGAIVPLVVAGLLRRWVAAGAALAVLVLLAGLVLPRAVSSGSSGSVQGERLQVMTANIEVGRADLEQLSDLVRGEHVDVLSVQELTPEAARAMHRAGIADLLSERVLRPASHSAGSGLYSRYPLRRLPTVPGSFEMPRARLWVPGAEPVELVSVHPNPPVDGTAVADWRGDLRALPHADPEGPIRLLPGDFNATLDHEELRDILGSGYVDAADARGKGLIPTWPSGRRFPPPVTIDHVLVDERVEVGDVSIHSLTGTDHRPIFVELGLPAGD
jgi:endonuclease/exonuclease/phosphatase family metal-dependent hydrolase